MLNVLTSDWEVTTFNKGNPFDQRNKAVCLGLQDNTEPAWCRFDIDYPLKNYCDIKCWDIWVFFNAKFDLHWYRREGFPLPENVWCCQVAEYILSGQKNRYPSLEETAVKYELGNKIDVVKLEYWDKGIQTDQIPKEILEEYCKQDVNLTYKVYQHQLKQFEAKPALYKLFKIAMQDLLVLEEMEWNGQIYDEQLCNTKAEVIDKDIAKITTEIASVYPEIPINFNSPDQLSAFLYGGTIYQESKIHDGFYGPKAQKAGQPKYKKVTIEHVLPQLVEPLKGSEMAKQGIFATDTATLKKLKGPAARKFIGPLLKLSELDKLNSTYYRGLVKKNLEMNWPPGKIHGQFNQVVAQTGRLSSSNPNVQNFASDCLDIFITRYAD